MLKNIDTSAPEFKTLIKQLNFMSKTRYEAHQEKKKQFMKLSTILNRLSPEEQRAFIHLAKNRRLAKATAGREHTEMLMDQVTDESDLEKLAEVAERENFEKKNRYIH